MKVQTSSYASVYEDEFVLAIGFRSSADGQQDELVIQCTKQVSEQDVKLGQDSAYVEVNGEGGYGILDQLIIHDSQAIEIRFDKQKMIALGLNWPTLRFEFTEAITEEALGSMRKGAATGKYRFQTD